MPITVRKGEFPTLVLRFPDYPDTSGGSGTFTVSVYGGGDTILSVQLSPYDNNTAMAAQLTAAEMDLLEAQTLYSCASNVVLPVYGVSVSHALTLNVVAESALLADMTLLHGKIVKPDGSPVGHLKKIPLATQDGMVMSMVWSGVTVTAKHIASTEFQDAIVGMDSVTAVTDSAGLFEMYVLKGVTVTVSCPSFGKSVLVDTTDLDTIDLSSFFLRR